LPPFGNEKLSFVSVFSKIKMSITITISPEAQSKLEKRAAVFGQDLKTFARNLLEREAALESLTEVAKPIYRQTDESKMSEVDLENLVDETLAEVRREKPLASR